MKKLFLSFIAMTLGVIAMNAQGAINLTGLSFEPGETKKFSVELNSETLYCGFQMDLVLPQGFSVAEVMNEDDELVKDITLDAARKKSTHIIECNDITGAIRIISYSTKNATYKGTNGALVNISVTASETVAAGSYSVELKNIELTTPDEVVDRFSSITSTFTIAGGGGGGGGDGDVTTGYTAAVNCAPQGDAMLSANYVEKGSPLKLLIAPNNGYKVSTLLLNGKAVDAKNNVYNIASVVENVLFDVAFEAVVPDTVEIEKIVTDTIEIEKIVTDTIEIEKIVTDTLEVEKIVTDTIEVEKIVTDTIEVEKIVTDTIEVEKIVTDTIKIKEIVTDTIEVEKIVTDTIEVEKIVTDTIIVEQTDTLIVEKIVIDTLVVEKIVTDTIEIETIETDTIYLAEINEIPAPEITFADGMLNISCALQVAKIYYSTDGTLPTKEYTAPVAINEDCVVMAIAVVASDEASMEIVGTGIGGVTDEIVSCRYFTEAGVEIDEPQEGINIMIVTYASGKSETKKVVVRKK